MRKNIALIICLFIITLANSQVESYLGSESALQRSEIIRAVPQESNGYLVMNQDSRIDQWIVNASLEGNIVKTYKTGIGENYVKMDSEIFNDWSYAYNLMGIASTGETILDIDFMPENGDPTWIYNGCNRPRCVKTSGNANYAYQMQVYEHVSNDSYRLKLGKAWSHIEDSLQVPYYIVVSDANLEQALLNNNISIAYPMGAQTYFPFNGDFKVALGMGQWHPDRGVVSNQINGIGGEGCTLSFGTAMSTMNALTPSLSTPLECTGQQYSGNQSGGGTSNPYGAYAATSSTIDDCILYILDYNLEFSHIDQFGVSHYTWVLNSTTVSLENCDETPTSPNSPCPPGYYYSPGGGDPCKPIEPIMADLKSVSLSPIDAPSAGAGETIEPGLYLMVLNYEEDISVPLYKEVENRINLRQQRVNSENEITILPNPAKDRVTISLREGENIISYSIFDYSGNEIRNGSFSSKSNQQTLELNLLKDGIYFIEVGSDVNSYVKRIIKN